MVLLVLFAFLAGAGTALSPCSLPILPALLSASATGGKRRPAGIVVGLVTTFTLTIVGLADLVNGVGLGESVTRDIAIVALFGFGLAVLIPPLAAKLEAPLYRLQSLGPKTKGDGFVSGLGVGAALGFVQAPCAGPILAAVIAATATTGKTVALGIAFAVGTGVVLFAIAIGGRGLVKRIAGGVRGLRLQQGLGGIMVLTAVLMAFSVDVHFQQAIAKHLPGFLVDPTESLEDSHAVASRLADFRGKPKFAPSNEQASLAPAPLPTSTPPLSPAPAATGATDAGTTGPAAATATAVPTDPPEPKLPKLGDAPEFTGTQKWFNGPPQSLKTNEAAHRATLVDFWTYTCINCLRTLPYTEAWDKKYRGAGLSIVGVHSPEFSFEKDAGNVADAIKRLGIKYSVVQDNNLATWNAWGNQYWPAEYLVDDKGQVRYVHFGEGDDDKTEAAIRSVLAEDGATQLGTDAQPKDVVTPSDLTSTPETYVGAERAMGWVKKPKLGTSSYTAPSKLAVNQFALGGKWNIASQAATAESGATIGLRFHAKDAYLVLAPPAAGRSGTVTVSLDGKPLNTIKVDRQRLYQLVDMPLVDTHDLKLSLSDGTQAYAFTFG